MVRITNSEQISLLLKARLEKMKSAKKGDKSTGVAQAQSVDHSPSDPLQELALDEALDDQDMGQALVRTILTREFGEDVASDPRFEQVVQKVSQILNQGEDGKALIDKAFAELRGRP